MSGTTGATVRALARFGLNSPNVARLAEFYAQACGARRQGHVRRDELRSSGLPELNGGADITVLTWGDALLELWEFDEAGRPYPQALSPYDTRFQHLALIVTDMQRAMECLQRTEGWSAISTGGPQTLPPEAGGVTAFKFRDPDGHPVEFLQFPSGSLPAYWRNRAASGIFSGIDHSAISVEDVDRSLCFYQSRGLRPVVRTLNEGRRQAYLDGIAEPRVDVIGLAPPRPTPHVELLHYRTHSRPPRQPLAANDVGATRLIFTGDQGLTAGGVTLLQDPDGHWLQITQRPDLLRPSR